MSIIKTKIADNSENKSIKISFSSNDDFYGYQQEIDNLTEITSEDLINPVEDGEMRRFKIEYDTQIRFYFRSVPSIDFRIAGFTEDEINKSFNFFNSFFILDIYDNYDPNTQTKISTTYLTKLGEAPRYDINSIDSQFQYIYIPESYINKQIIGFPIAFIKFSFYDAKYGKVDLFYNRSNVNDSTPLRNYFPIVLNLENKTWRMANTLSAYDAYEIMGESYVDKVNDTFNTLNNNKQIYPNGETFENDGTYSTE